MARIVEGVALIAVGIGLAFFTFGSGAFIADALFPFFEAAIGASLSIGASLTLGGIAQALQPGPSAPFSIRQAAAPRVCCYGQSRISGTIVYISTAGSDLHQVIVWAAHACQSVQNVYLDGRLAHLSGNSGDGNTYTDDSGNQYSFGSSVLSIYHSLGPVPGTYFAALGAADSNWNSGCTLDGLTASHIRCGYDANKWSGPPGIKATIYGKNDIYDPRTASRGYTNNAALVWADFMCDSQWGVGCDYATEIDETQLVAAANICDELVALAAGGSERRYTINGYFDTTSTPGEIMDAMLQAMEGRASYTGGVWKIYPAAWYGSALFYSENDCIDDVQWIPSRKYRDLVNTVRATYISPKYPYAITGYDQDHKDSSIFTGEWQPTDIPEYAQDAGHGYASDANLAQDGGVKLYATRGYRFTTSVSMAQRLAKIYLLRNRFQGSGTLRMSMAAYRLQAQDNFQFSFAALGFVNKYLEVDTFKLVPKMDGENKEAPSLYCELTVNETDPSIYLWNTAEERTPANTASPAFLDPYTVAPPSVLTLTSGQAQAIVGVDGIIQPRIEIQWVSPSDPFVASGGYVEIQWQINGAVTWNGLGQTSPLLNTYYLAGLVNGTSYNVRMRSVRANGAASAWVVAGPEPAVSIGSLVSNSHGLNAVPNYGFESSILGGSVGDNWNIAVNTGGCWLIARELAVGFQHSGIANLLIRVNPSIAIPNGFTASARVFTPNIPISGGEALYYGGHMSWSSDGTPLNPSLTVLQRVGLFFYDNGGSFISEQFIDISNTPNSVYQNFSTTTKSPITAAYCVFQCAAFILNTSGSSQNTPAGLSAELRFDDVFMTQQSNSGLLTAQGSIQPTQSIKIPYTVSTSGATFTWSGQSVLRSDGSTLTITNGSLTYSGLSASTTYYTYWYADPTTGILYRTNSTSPPTSPDSFLAAQAALDGRIPLGTISFTTTASGSGSGIGGGGDICPEAEELVDVRGRGATRADEIAAGDWVRGKSFKTGEDVFRRVLQVAGETSNAWRIVQGHRVSPCEPIFYEGKWQAAYHASSVVDTFHGRKVKISVEADEYDEMNYYLVGDSGDLLIHNMKISPC